MGSYPNILRIVENQSMITLEVTSLAVYEEDVRPREGPVPVRPFAASQRVFRSARNAFDVTRAVIPHGSAIIRREY